MSKPFLAQEQDTIVDGYRVIGELGAGGMGVVFKAFDSRENRFVAIKMIGQAPSVRATVLAGARPRDAAFNAGRRMMLVREASLARRLEHPNIVRVFDYGQYRGLLYLVMEYLEGMSLDRVIANGGGPALDQKLEMGAQLLDALAFAHSHGIIHRDIKPPNTFLCNSGLVKVLDFGLVATFSQIAQGRVNKGGTLFYMAPEALVGGSDQRADIWAAGITIYELITGAYPFAAPSAGEIYSNIFHLPCPPLPESMPHSAELHAILSNALSKDPAQRYASAAEFARDLRRVTGMVANGVFSGARSGEAGLSSSSSAPTMDIHSAGKKFEEEIVLEERSSRLRRVIGFIDRLEPMEVWAGTLVTMVGGFFVLGIFGLMNVGPYADLWALLGIIALIPAMYFLFGTPRGALVPLGMADFWSAIPHCRNCAHRMDTVDQMTRFAFSPAEIQFALADCISALQENLWEDAVKLFSIHTHEFAPSITNTVADAPLRYHLGFYECHRCGQRCAQLITDEKDGEHWLSRPEFVRAYKSSPLQNQRPTALVSMLGFFRNLGQAAKAGFSRSAFPRSVVIILLAIAIFVGAVWFITWFMWKGPWDARTPP